MHLTLRTTAVFALLFVALGAPSCPGERDDSDKDECERDSDCADDEYCEDGDCFRLTEPSEGEGEGEGEPSCPVPAAGPPH